MVLAYPVGQRTHLLDVEVVDLDGDADAAEIANQLRGLLDCLGTVVIGQLVAGHTAATGADHRRTCFA